MSEEKRFLDQAGLKEAFKLIKSLFATKESVEKLDEKVANLQAEANVELTGKIDAVDTKLAEEIERAQAAEAEALQNAKDYTDAEVEKINNAADELAGKVEANTTAIGTINDKLDVLNADDQTEGSIDNKVATEVAKIVADADEKYDTLKEIADFILSDTTGAAKMANDIADLQKAIGEEGSVAEQIKAAVDAEAETARAAEEANATAISDEETRAKEAEEALQNAIDAEKERAEAKESELADAIKAEQARAEEAEAKLQAEYDSIGRITEPVINALFDGAQVAMTIANGEIKTFESIEAAVAEAEAGDVIELAEDIKLTENLKVADGVTIVANGRVIVC